MRDFTKITAWKLADDFTVAVYEATRSFPREEVYGLTSQLRRAAYSAPANIAEGASRSSKRDYLHFLYIARGSCSEAQYFVHLSGRLGYLDDGICTRLRDQSAEVGRTLGGLIRAVESELNPIDKVASRISSSVILLTSSLISKFLLGSTVYGLQSTV